MSIRIDHELLGKTVTEIRDATDEDMDMFGLGDCSQRPNVIVLDDDIILFTLSDPEGNGAGCMIYSDANKDQFYV